MPQRNWERVIDTLDFAFQPIVNIHTGACFGYEALLRNHEKAGFKSIDSVFDEAAESGGLNLIDLMMREKLIRKFTEIQRHDRLHLFINLDNRVLGIAEAQPGDTTEILDRYKLTPGSVTFEISEKHQVKSVSESQKILRKHKHLGYKLAIDDFGTGFSGLQLLYSVEPDFIKIDRFFISDIATDSKKKLFVASIVNISHLLGILVIAEGVETELEYFSCKEIGCDLVQGYFIQRPSTNTAMLSLNYPAIEILSRRDRRRNTSDQRIISEQIEYIHPIRVNTEMSEVFESFRRHKQNTFFPVINSMNEPIGVVREVRLKEYVYSQYGNKSLRNLLPEIVSKCSIADVHSDAERILEIFSRDDNTDGIIIIEDLKYIGFLSAKSLIKVIHEIKITAARDQNPLTRLPGNYLIYEYVSKALDNNTSLFSFVYFDFDNFKPFNDHYGFRSGDRAILLFAELLKKEFMRENCFIGHIGGDDFFVGFKDTQIEMVQDEVARIMRTFSRDVEAFYDFTDRENGYISGRDREGVIKRYPLLTVAAAILETGRGRARISIDEISCVIADMKKVAKSSPLKISTASMLTLKPKAALATTATALV